MQKRNEKPTFSHVIIEVSGLNPETLLNKKMLRETINEFIHRNSLKVLKRYDYSYSKQSHTYLYLLSSSHLVIHTWPEYSYLHIDLLQCRTINDLLAYKQAIVEIIEELFHTKNVIFHQLSYS